MMQVIIAMNQPKQDALSFQFDNPKEAHKYADALARRKEDWIEGFLNDR